jgi:hypothetical protein
VLSAWLNREHHGCHLVISQQSWAMLSGSLSRTGRSSGLEDALAQACAAIPVESSAAIYLWLSGRLCPAIWLQPPKGISPGEEWKQWVQHAVLEVHPFPESLIEPVIWVDQKRPAPTLVSALPATWLASIEQALGKRYRRLQGVRPLWQAGIDRVTKAMPNPTVLTVFDGESATSLSWREGRLDGATTLAMVPAASQAWAWHQRRVAAPDTACFVAWRPDRSGAAGDSAWSSAWQVGDHP